MNKIKKFFVRAGAWCKKVGVAIANFFKENVWAGVLAIVVVILLFILIVQGIVKGIDKCKNNTAQDNSINRATTITSTQLMEKLKKNETFVLFIGSATCSHCHDFYTTINRYVNSGHTVYYLDLADTSDPTLKKYMVELQEMLINSIDDDRNITSLSTPTTIYVEKGEFKDAVQGAYGMEGGTNYLIFCDVVEGKYVGKDVYKFQ